MLTLLDNTFFPCQFNRLLKIYPLIQLCFPILIRERTLEEMEKIYGQIFTDIQVATFKNSNLTIKGSCHAYL